jgi:hypothetical protein
MKPPANIRNAPQWEEHCRMIRARALDLIEGRLSVIESARVLSKLAYWAQLNDDSDLTTFVAIDSETDTLPVGEVRKHWAQHALEREDIEIEKAENLYRASAIESARRLAERFEWALHARVARRDSGHAV